MLPAARAFIMKPIPDVIVFVWGGGGSQSWQKHLIWKKITDEETSILPKIR